MFLPFGLVGLADGNNNDEGCVCNFKHMYRFYQLPELARFPSCACIIDCAHSCAIKPMNIRNMCCVSCETVSMRSTDPHHSMIIIKRLSHIPKDKAGRGKTPALVMLPQTDRAALGCLKASQ